MRILALDLGERRIGVAVSDATGVLASGHSTIERTGDRSSEHRRVQAVVEEMEAERVIVGLPLSMSGREGPAARAAVAEVEELRGKLSVPVELCDERLTTVSASRSLSAAGVSIRKQRKGGRIDQQAAAVLLQSWLDQAEPAAVVARKPSRNAAGSPGAGERST